MKEDFCFDVVVIGAGHAGCEAARISATMGAETCLITMDIEKTAQMSCNPAIGGIAKGQIVREIDALGGMMGIVTDMNAIQFRMLNRSKGPAMWSPRAQCDRMKYSSTWRTILENTPHLKIWQDQVKELITENGKVAGLRTIWGVTFKARCVVITAGTFLNGLMHIGRNMVEGGRISEPAAKFLTESIAANGIRSGRMKTGTPVRIDGRSVHFDELEKQDGENDFHRFSFNTEKRVLPQLPCWLCSTNEKVHEILRSGLNDSPLYNGQIKSIGPRYCPSIETKLHTFPDKDRHPLFLEPEGTDTNEYYLNGFSSSLPMETQIAALKEIAAFRDLVIYRPGYAIEYDFFDPTQLKHSLESKQVDGLFLAGQVNGTTGYEEAGGQGLIAGINAALKCSGSNPFTMRRDESYIGVLIDDLVTKGVDEPYRMFTSRAEYRILLRQDNADTRLTPYAIKFGIIDAKRADKYSYKQEAIQTIMEYCRKTSVKPNDINSYLETQHTAPLREGCKIKDLIERPELSIKSLCNALPKLKDVIDRFNEQQEEISEAAEIELKYRGYIQRERIIANKMQRLDSIRIKGHFDYEKISQLSTEARQKLAKIDPETLAQAEQIPGVSPSDINILLVMMHR